ncbi:RidA family protein [Lipingzhangella sp. LS1_29]|uniref:RidA family protein n=1 Tax=Lipingzhangella rawalii TaxID=2055835 RepID=A0ABU2H289_9ACTN|nr:RidA family protein [Lipingzhangella rawalii]MDS1269117.1 RidA family protein [Lipingzhangella rawalii]
MPESVTLVRSDTLTDQVDYAYAAVVDLPSARAVWTAGACPLDTDGNTVAPGDYVGQAHQVMHNLKAALDSAGVDRTDIVKTTVYVASADQGDLVAAWTVVRSHLGEHDPPSTLLGVAALGYDHQLVEVEAVALAR